VYARGKLIHDAHIVALMRQHEVDTIRTNDKDFTRFPGIRVIDPFA
jgi:predicted nucleic acid-binding protein